LNKWDFVGKTEVIDKSVNPEWKKSFHVPYKFEVHQLFKIIVYHIIDNKKISDWDAQLKVGEI